jgi:uncharacterized protein with HEPN domain
MSRDSRASLRDSIECRDSIRSMLKNVAVDEYRQNRILRRATEREFTIIGEAVLALSHRDPASFDAISNARRIIDFRNQLTHAYPTISDDLVWGIAVRDAPVLREECASLLDHLDR